MRPPKRSQVIGGTSPATFKVRAGEESSALPPRGPPLGLETTEWVRAQFAKRATTFSQEVEPAPSLALVCTSSLETAGSSVDWLLQH